MYTKLFASITDSSIWGEANHVRIVWITLLAKSDFKGFVWASVPGLAAAARVSLDDCVEALEKLSSPDKWSRTKAHEGRRIAEIDGGWILLNYEKHRKIRNEEERREYIKIKVREHREKKKENLKGIEIDVNKPVNNVINVNRGKPIQIQRQMQSQKEDSKANGSTDEPCQPTFDGITEPDKITEKPKPVQKLTDEEWISKIRTLYPKVDIDEQIAKMQAWLLTPKGSRRKLTRQFIVNWLNRIDVPVEVSEKEDAPWKL